MSVTPTYYAAPIQGAARHETGDAPHGVFVDDPEFGALMVARIEAGDMGAIASMFAAAPELLEVAQRWWAVLEATGAACSCGADADPLFPSTGVMCSRCEVRAALVKAGVMP